METRQCVNSTPPRLQHCRKEWKRGGVWTPHRLVFDATGRRNEAACGFHAISLSMPQGGETTRRRGIRATSLGSRLLPGPGCSSSFAFSNYWLLGWSVSCQPSDWSMTCEGDEVALTSLNEGRGSRWLGCSQWGGC